MIASMATTSVAPPSLEDGIHGKHTAGKIHQKIATSMGTRPFFYVMPTRPTVEASYVIVTGILTICTLNAYPLVDPRSMFPYVTHALLWISG